MNKPLLEVNTEKALQQLIAKPPHALLLSGPTGIGKATVADWFVDQLTIGHHVLKIEPEKGKVSIGVEAVQQLEHFLSLKVSSQQAINRLARIDNAQQLTVEAQNAMLKTLEEPPKGTLLLLTSSEPESLLPTVRSRLQTIEIQKPSAKDLLAALPKQQDNNRIMALSGGLPGLAFALANDDKSHHLVKAAQLARELLKESTFARMAKGDSLAKDKTAAANLLYILMQMAHAALVTGRGAERWQQVLKASYTAESDIRRGAQPKLALTKLMLNL